MTENRTRRTVRLRHQPIALAAAVQQQLHGVRGPESGRLGEDHVGEAGEEALLEVVGAAGPELEVEEEGGVHLDLEGGVRLGQKNSPQVLLDLLGSK